MSRSRKKTPIVGASGASDKYDKQIANRRLRTRVRRELNKGNHDYDGYVFPSLREISDIWNFASDGKYWVRYSSAYYQNAIRK